MHAILQRAAEGRLQVEVKHPGIEPLQAELARGRRQRWQASSGGALLLAGTLWLGLEAAPQPLGWVLLAAGVALLLVSRPGNSA